jgi:hypothetical protein
MTVRGCAYNQQVGIFSIFSKNKKIPKITAQCPLRHTVAAIWKTVLEREEKVNC